MAHWLAQNSESQPMRILEYVGLNTSRAAKTYRKVIEAIAADDFRGAQVKKLANLSHGKFYRARLDDANRLLTKTAYS